jgi:hypothetical protein
VTWELREVVVIARVLDVEVPLEVLVLEEDIVAKVELEAGMVEVVTRGSSWSVMLL